MISIAFVDIAAGSALFCEFNNDTEFNISMGIKMSMVHSRNAHERLSVEVVDRIFGILWDTSDKTTHQNGQIFFTFAFSNSTNPKPDEGLLSLGFVASFLSDEPVITRQSIIRP